MCQIAHNLPVESAIQAKTGTSFWSMFSIRIIISLMIGFILNLILPAEMGMPSFMQTSAENMSTLVDVLTAWGLSMLKLAILIIGVVALLMILYQILEERNLIKKLSQLIAPILKFFGLPQSTAFLWLIGNIVGLAYGGALMIDQMHEGKISKSEGSLLNYHLAVSHSVIEDNLLFAALGVSIWWILATRLIAAWIVVWLKRGLIELKKKISTQIVTDCI